MVVATVDMVQMVVVVVDIIQAVIVVDNASRDGTAEWLKPWTWFTAARWSRIGGTF